MLFRLFISCSQEGDTTEIISFIRWYPTRSRLFEAHNRIVDSRVKNKDIFKNNFYPQLFPLVSYFVTRDSKSLTRREKQEAQLLL